MHYVKKITTKKLRTQSNKYYLKGGFMKTLPEITWLGHGTFKVVSNGGKVILIDPWVDGNPACPQDKKNFEKVDLMLITHGHFDHIGDAITIANKFSPDIIAIYETSAWLEKKGVKKCFGMNKGGTTTIQDITVTMVHADHSSGILDNGNIVYGGEAVGYVVKLEDGFTFYHSGDTNLFGDMVLIGEIYKPDLAFLPIGSVFTMGPKESAYAVSLIRPKYVIPMHFKTFPILIQDTTEFKKLVKKTKVKVLDLKPGDTIMQKVKKVESKK